MALSQSQGDKLMSSCIQYNITITNLQKLMSRGSAATSQSKLSEFVQPLLILADNFDALGSKGKFYSLLCHAQIEILKLVKSGDLVDLNSASEGIQELINNL